MNRFCVQCGSAYSESDRFCGECGAPTTNGIKAKTAAPDSGKPNALPRVSMRGMVWVVGGIALLCIGGVAAVFLSGPSQPPQATALSKLLNANTNFVRAHTCLNNFNYGTDPVDVSTWSKNTQNWLQVLVDGGIYNPPKTITGAGFLHQDVLRYTQTPAAKAQVQGKLLCFAKGINIDTVIYHDVHTSDGIRYVLGSAKYHYDSPAAWTTSAGAREQMPQLFDNDSHDINIALMADQNSDWQLTSPAKIAVLEQKQLLSKNANVEQNSTSSISQFFSNLFTSNPAQKFMGKWTANATLFSFKLELRPDTIVFMGKETPATYESQGKDILIKTPDNEVNLLMTPISSDEIMMGWQGVNLHFHRIQ